MTKKTRPKKPLGTGMAKDAGNAIKGRAGRIANAVGKAQARKEKPKKVKPAPKAKSKITAAQRKKYNHPNPNGVGGLIIRRP
jgi:hypothetical protein